MNLCCVNTEEMMTHLGQNFVHATTRLLWHVQNFDPNGSLVTDVQLNSILLDLSFELMNSWWKSLNGIDTHLKITIGLICDISWSNLVIFLYNFWFASLPWCLSHLNTIFLCHNFSRDVFHLVHQIPLGLSGAVYHKISSDDMWPLLLTWFNFNLSMDK